VQKSNQLGLLMRAQAATGQVAQQSADADEDADVFAAAPISATFLKIGYI